ncbi:hypothetical protein G9A89_014364 [Geosiphon pyriformis]|nr:hypothetical protein G9A89_014364 [Geosiphon pyriformis]
MLSTDPLSNMNLIEWPSILALVYMVVISFFLSAALLNKSVDDSSSSSNRKIAVSDLLLVIMAEDMLLVSGKVWLVSILLGETFSGVTKKLK